MLKANNSLWKQFDPSSNQSRENFVFESRLCLHKLWIEEIELEDFSFLRELNLDNCTIQ